MKYLLLCIIVSIVSCKEGEKTININETIKSTIIQNKKPIQINLRNSSKKENLADHIENIKAVKLKTSVKLVHIDKVVFYNDNYFILDKKTSNLLVFDDKGNYIHKIGEQGNGPGEYKKITDFEIDKKNQQILILAAYDKALYKFSLDGAFRKRLVFDFFVNDGFVITDKNTYAFMPGPGGASSFHSLIGTDVNGKMISKDFPYPKDIELKGFMYTGKLHRQGNTNYFNEMTSSLVYEIQDSISPLYQFNFGNDTWREENRYDINSFIRKNHNLELSYLTNFYCDTDNVLAFQFTNQNYRRKGYYFKYTDTYLAVPFNLEDSFLYRFLDLPVGIKDDCFISSLNYELYEILMKSKKVDKFKASYPGFYNGLQDKFKDFTENDNPYLLIYEVK